MQIFLGNLRKVEAVPGRIYAAFASRSVLDMFERPGGRQAIKSKRLSIISRSWFWMSALNGPEEIPSADKFSLQILLEFCFCSWVHNPFHGRLLVKNGAIMFFAKGMKAWCHSWTSWSLSTKLTSMAPTSRTVSLFDFRQQAVHHPTMGRHP